MKPLGIAFLLSLLAASSVSAQTGVHEAKQARASDWRFFLSTNTGRLIRQDTGWRRSYEGAAEILYRWDTLHGEPAGPFSPNFGLEWVIPSMDYTPGYLLQDLQADRAALEWQNVDSLECSFIYRLGEDAEDYRAEPLFVIAYYGVRIDSVTGKRSRTLIDSSVVSYDSYADFTAHRSNEDPELLRFPDVTGKYVHPLAIHPRAERYAMDYKRLGMIGADGRRYTTIDCCVRRLQLIDLWVRGLRVTDPERIK